MKKLFIFINLFCISTIVFCQEQSQSNTIVQKIDEITNQNFDSIYIEKYTPKFIFVLESLNFLDNYNLKTDNGKRIELQSDLSYNLGTTIGYGPFTLGYSFNINKLVLSKKSKNSNLNFSISTNLVEINFSYFKNNGEIRLNNFYNFDQIPNENYFFNGLNTKLLAIKALYYLNHKHYANNSAYSTTFNYIQKRSAGSFIVGISYTHQNLYFDFKQLRNDFDIKVDDYNGRYNTISLNFGYGYNLVFKKYWIANISLLSAAGIKSNTMSRSSSLNFEGTGRMSIVYNHPFYFAGINVTYNTNFNIITNSVGNFNLFIGLRL